MISRTLDEQTALLGTVSRKLSGDQKLRNWEVFNYLSVLNKELSLLAYYRDRLNNGDPEIEYIREQVIESMNRIKSLHLKLALSLNFR